MYVGPMKVAQESCSFFQRCEKRSPFSISTKRACTIENFIKRFVNLNVSEKVLQSFKELQNVFCRFEKRTNNKPNNDIPSIFFVNCIRVTIHCTIHMPFHSAYQTRSSHSLKIRLPFILELSNAICASRIIDVWNHFPPHTVILKSSHAYKKSDSV